MRALPPELQARLDAGATTLCWCWRLARADGAVFGFTEHDGDLSVDGVLFRAGTARLEGRLESELGFAAHASALAGALESEAIDEFALAAGLFDAARLDVLRVDWTEPSLHVLVWSGRLGAVRRGELGFEAEVRGLQADLEADIGRVIQRRCDAELGDARCGASLTAPAHNGAGLVSAAVDARSFRATGLESFASGWFANGVLTWTSGANAGAGGRLEAHRLALSEAALELLTPPASPILAGDAFTVLAGCDKRLATCRDKFDNVVNFRGFPMSPGDDWALAPARPGERNDGGSLWTDRDG